jgi:IMP cyclohydrolase (EC 3.5.4.10)/phosphoribosylaminoimidazolecarboxamide formyltransferase (EC 2.1.2.3)
VVVAVGFNEGAMAVFRDRSGWGQEVRLLVAALCPEEPTVSLRAVRGGYLAQTGDEEPDVAWQVVTERRPSAEDLLALRWAWTVVRHVTSNAVAVARPNRLLGVGAGQMNRVRSVRLALEQAGDEAKGAALASDAFFPFPDSVEAAAGAGITAIVQPGGSKRDGDVVARANELGLAMVFTGVRHFRH